MYTAVLGRAMHCGVRTVVGISVATFQINTICGEVNYHISAPKHNIAHNAPAVTITRVAFHEETLHLLMVAETTWQSVFLLTSLHLPHSAYHTPLTTLRLPHSAYHTPLTTLHSPHSTYHTILMLCPEVAGSFSACHTRLELYIRKLCSLVRYLMIYMYLRESSRTADVWSTLRADVCR